MCTDVSLQNGYGDLLSQNYGYSVYSEAFNSVISGVGTGGYLDDLIAPFSFFANNYDSQSVCSFVGASSVLGPSAEGQAQVNVSIQDDFLNFSWASKLTGPSATWYSTCYETAGGSNNWGGWFFY